MTRSHLRAVAAPDEQPADVQPADVTALLRAEIAARDWAAVHVRSDRSRPIELPERVRRLWRK